jgi:hypothetical protein
MKTNREERKAIAQKHIRTLQGQVKIADAKFQKSKEYKSILKKKAEVEHHNEKIRELNRSMQQDIDDLNEAKGWGEYIKITEDRNYSNGTYEERLRLDIVSEYHLREEIEQEICIAQIDSLDLKTLFQKLSEVFKV